VAPVAWWLSTLGDRSAAVRLSGMAGGEVGQFEDAHGYRVRDRDLGFLGISMADYEALRAHLRPLGMTPSQFDYFQGSLFEALERDQVDTYDARLQGSSARFFSGGHKPMPWTRDEMVEEFRHGRGRIPLAFEIDDAIKAMLEVWPNETNRPYLRPFDSMYVLGLNERPSDYDVQISSSIIVERSRQRIRQLGLAASRLTVESAQYAFVRKDLVEDTCPSLYQWWLRLSDVTRRNVTVAVFEDAGPPDTGSTFSSHFRDDDWRLDGQQTGVGG
jgi:hypothetical protein